MNRVVAGILGSALDIEGKNLTTEDYRDPNPRIYGNMSGRRLGIAASGHLQAYGGTKAVDRVMTNVRLIMETASAADYHFERDGERYELFVPPTEDGRSVKKAPRELRELFDAPNPWFSYEDMIELMIIDLLLVGNTFLLKFRTYDGGKPLAMYRLAPPLVTIHPGTSQLVEKYEYKVPGEMPVTYQPEEVVHIKLVNPNDPFVGVGLIKGGPRVYDTELNVVETAASFYERGAMWLGLLQTDRTVGRETIKKVRRTLAGLYGGPGNSGQVAILERGMTWTSVSSDARQAALVEMSKMSVQRIDSHFRTSKALFGDLENTDKQTAREAQRIFDKKTMRPLLDRIERAISRGVTQAWNLDFKIDYEYEMAPEDAIDLAAGLATIPGIRVREVRKLAQLEPLGDERDEWVLNLPGENDNESEVKDPAVGGEAGRPPNAENTQAFPEPGKKPGKDVMVSTKPGPQPKPVTSRAAGRPSQRKR
jgi:HK97 family phage portal protein